MKEKRHTAAWVLEALGLLACIGLGAWFVYQRQCRWEGILAAVWAVTLLALGAGVFWAERRRARDAKDRRGNQWNGL